MKTAELVLLELLAEAPDFGLGLQDRAPKHPGGMTFGHEIYVLLRRLEREGILVSHEKEGPPSRGVRPRIFYELTGAGRARLVLLQKEQGS